MLAKTDAVSLNISIYGVFPPGDDAASSTGKRSSSGIGLEVPAKPLSFRPHFSQGVIPMNTDDRTKTDVFRLTNRETSVTLTARGAQMAPVRFFSDSETPLEPYYVSPWQNEPGPVPGPGVLGALRGDFFCMPFGGDNHYKGENHPVHGEVSEAEWTLREQGSEGAVSSIELELQTRVRPGRVRRRIEIRDGESNLYICHRVEGFAGPVTYGHHAILPGDRTHLLSTPPLIQGICDTDPPDPSSREYYWAEPGALFRDLKKVPTIWKKPEFLDAGVFPGRDGFVNILQVFPRLPEKGQPQWITATVPEHGYLWFSLKDPEQFPSTLLWQEQHGRHEAPWSGRNSCMGVEEVLGHLASGLGKSVEENALSRQGLSTWRELSGTEPLTLRNIQGVCRIPADFDRVADLRFQRGMVEFIAESGSVVQSSIDWEFLFRD